MTLIACTINAIENYPIITGDLLLSSNAGKKATLIPTILGYFSKFFTPKNNYHPSSLAQKIYIIKDNVCLAMAGNRREMRNFLEDFRIYCRSNASVDRNAIVNFLDNYPFKDVMCNSAFLIAVAEKRNKNKPNLFVITYPDDESPNGSWKIFRTKLFSEAYACGTGSNTYVNLIRKLTLTNTKGFENPSWKSISDNILAIVQFLAIESVTLDFTISDLWGGGFEMIYYNGKTFEKLSEVAYVIHLGEYDDNGEIGYPAPKMILYTKYHDDDLLITAIYLHKGIKNEEGDIVKMISKKEEYSIQTFAIAGIDSPEASIKVNELDLSFETETVAIGYAILNKNTNRTITLPQFSNANPNFKVIYKQENDLEISIPKNILETLKTQGKESYQNL